MKFGTAVLNSRTRSLCSNAMFVLCSMAAVTAAQASAVSLNVAGDGLAGAIAYSQGLNVQGSGFVLAQASATGVSFSELGAYQMVQADGTSPIGSRDVTLLYSAGGQIDPLTGALSFTSGAFNLYADMNINFASASSDPVVIFGANDGDLIASFQISSGNGTPYGQVHMTGQAVAGSIRPGYFFSSSGDDLSLSGNLQFVIDIGNVLDDAPSAAVVSEIVCKATGLPLPGCDGTPYFNTPYSFVVKDGGLATLSSADVVPEPGSMALALFGLTGVGAFARRSRRGNC